MRRRLGNGRAQGRNICSADNRAPTLGHIRSHDSAEDCKVRGCHTTCGSQQLAPGIVTVAHYLCAEAVDDSHHITLQVGDIVVKHIVIRHRCGRAGSIVGKVQRIGTHRHLAQAATIIHIGVGGGAVAAAGAHVVGIVGKAPCGSAAGHGFQLSAPFPGVGPGAVIERVVVGIIGNGHAIVRRQQIAPGCVAVGINNRIRRCFYGSSSVGVLCLAENITGSIIGPDPGLARGLVILPDQLIGSIVFIAGGIGASGDGFLRPDNNIRKVYPPSPPVNRGRWFSLVVSNAEVISTLQQINVIVRVLFVLIHRFFYVFA